MALVPARSDLYTPSVVKVFTTFATTQTLHEAVGASATGAAPAAINHMPARLFVGAAAADVLAGTDAFGNAVSITFVRAFDGALPFVLAALASSTTVDHVTVAWNPEP